MALSIKERLKLSRFFTGEKPVDHPVELSHRRIFILPTARGMGFALLLILLLLIAFVYNNNLAYLLTFLLTSVFIITIFHSFKMLAGLVIHASSSHSVFAGEAARFIMNIDNPTAQPRPNLQIQLRSPRSFRLDRYEQKSLALYEQTRKRGWLSCNTVTLSSTYPLGLFRVWSPVRFNIQALVYPKPSQLIHPFPETDGNSRETGHGRKGNEDFSGIKTYQNGDPVRRIHWKALAKGQGLFSKEFSGAADTELWLDFSTTPGKDLEERLSLLCRWVIDAEQAGLRYGLVLPGHKLHPGLGGQHLARCLETLALF